MKLTRRQQRGIELDGKFRFNKDCKQNLGLISSARQINQFFTLPLLLKGKKDNEERSKKFWEEIKDKRK